jgi:RNA polymerase sigma-70 factor (ECF subfamily)
MLLKIVVLMTAEQLESEYVACKGALQSYLLRITASVPDTEDIVQDTYLKAAEKLTTFRGDSSLKTWLFAIATNLAKDNMRARKRWSENVTDIAREAAHEDPNFFREAKHLQNTSPYAQFEIREHIAFCFTCIAKSLPLEQQLSLLLKEVYTFKLEEIAQILRSSLEMIKYYLHTGRTKMIQLFDGRCALVSKKGVCHQCSELNGLYNPKQKFQEEAVKIEMVKAAANSDKEHLLDLRMQILRDIDPFTSPASALQLHHLAFNQRVMENS